jgi:NAD(P)-dependent dehydrogenase (short-subunit alcohol dehydrogenase family)
MAQHTQPVALVTGANRGIGREVARQLADRDLTVVLGSRDLDSGQAAADALTRQGARASSVPLDVTSPEGPFAAVRLIEDRHGRLDVLVNNAGRIVEAGAVVTTADDLRAVFETNVFGAVEMIRATLPLLRSSPAARIVNVSSTTASLTLTAGGTDFGGDAAQRLAYSTSKTALNMLTVQYDRAFRVDPALRHIKINAATLGYTATDMNQNRGHRTVEEGARIVVELALLPDGGPSGGFFNDAGPVPW